MSAQLHIELTGDDDPLAMLATFIDIATPVLATFGYAPEEKYRDAARDWVHWNRGRGDVIRAYAFRDDDRSGVRILGQGEIRAGVGHAVIERVAESTSWRRATPS